MAITMQSNYTSDNAAMPGEFVDPTQLVCPGCADVVACEPPAGWAAGSAGPAPSFSHRDGSVLCPDSRGRASEPVETDAVPV